MDQLIEFVGNNLLLVGAALIVAAMLIHNIATDVGTKNNIDPHRATELINRQDALVVDVRPMADFNKGHIINARNIPMGSLEKQLAQLEKHKDKPVIVACRSGAQSAVAARQLRKHGFEGVHNLKGGILAWQSANLPVSRK